MRALFLAVISGWLMMAAPHSFASFDKTDVLFVPYTVEEGQAFLDIQTHLDEMGIAHRTLALGPSRWLFQDHPSSMDVDVLLLPTHENDPLPFEMLTETLGLVAEQVLYTGMSSMAQGQIATVAAREGVEVVGYYSSLRPMVSAVPVYRFLHEANAVHRLHLSHPMAALNVHTIPAFTESVVQFVGQPALQAWRDEREDINVPRLRNTLNIGAYQPVALVLADFSTTFSSSMRMLVDTAMLHPEWLFLISLPDGYPANQVPSLNNVHGIEAAHYAPETLATIASAIIAFESPEAQQAFLAGKPVVFVHDGGEPPALVFYDLAARVESAQQLGQWLGQVWWRADVRQLVVPEPAALIIANRLAQRIESVKKERIIGVGL